MRGWVSSAHRDARRIVVERCARSRRPSSFPFAFASSLCLSLSLSRARDDERGTVRVASRRPVDARRARPIERDARATDERWWRSLSALRLDADARARRDDTVTRDDQRRRRADADAPRGASKKGASSSSSSSSNDGSMSRSCRFFRLVSFPRTDRPFLAARETGGLSKSRVVVESDGFTYKKRKSTKGVVGVTIAEPLWNGRGKDARALVRVNASNASAMSSGEARGREDFQKNYQSDMPEDERMQLLCESVCRRSAGPSCHS